ncbi:MAG: hypothetical protein ACREKL_10230 [Chthoniobacterales bacterium]
MSIAFLAILLLCIVSEVAVPLYCRGKGFPLGHFLKVAILLQILCPILVIVCFCWWNKADPPHRGVEQLTDESFDRGMNFLGFLLLSVLFPIAFAGIAAMARAVACRRWLRKGAPRDFTSPPLTLKLALYSLLMSGLAACIFHWANDLPAVFIPQIISISVISSCVSLFFSSLSTIITRHHSRRISLVAWALAFSLLLAWPYLSRI